MVYQLRGIGEHPDLFETLESEVEKLASAKDKLNSVQEVTTSNKKYIDRIQVTFSSNYIMDFYTNVHVADTRLNKQGHKKVIKVAQVKTFLT